MNCVTLECSAVMIHDQILFKCQTYAENDAVYHSYAIYIFWGRWLGVINNLPYK